MGKGALAYPGGERLPLPQKAGKLRGSHLGLRFRPFRRVNASKVSASGGKAP